MIAITLAAITLFMAATIAITATDIKRVLAYSTVSQLGYMMMALGVGGWLGWRATSCSRTRFSRVYALFGIGIGDPRGSFQRNDRRWVACARKCPGSRPTRCWSDAWRLRGREFRSSFGFSGYYSKDAILEQALSFGLANGGISMLFFIASAGGAAITAFYMFRLWYMTFAGEARDHHRYDHAHESPFTMYAPLILLSVFAVGAAWGMNHYFHALNDALVGSLLAAVILLGLVAWTRLRGSDDDAQVNTSWAKLPLILCGVVFVIGLVWMLGSGFTLPNMLAQARPAGTGPTETAALVAMTWPDESLSHADAIKVPATVVASCTALAGFLLATVFYGWRFLDPDEVRRQFSAIHKFLLNKWYFDELYDLVWVRPTHWLSGIVAGFDRSAIDRFLDGLAGATRKLAVFWENVADRQVVDGSVNALARAAYALGSSLRSWQTGSLRNYVLFIVVGMLAFFVLASFLLSGAFAS